MSTKEEGLAIGSQGLETHHGLGTQGDSIEALQFALKKRKANLAAKLALHGGYVCEELDSGEFLISRWGLHRFCASIDEAEGFARRVGAMK